MTDRSARIDSFLDSAGWADATRAAMAGDLSARRYLRLARNAGTAILMDAPPDTDASTPAFVAMTEWLRGFGLSAPRILAAKPELGLLLLEDLGDLKVSDLVNAGPSERLEIYDTILDLLLLIRAQSVPALPCPKPAALVAMTRLADDHYPGLNTAGILPFRSVLETIFRDLAATAPTVSLRDFHADNLMWLPEREGVARLGLLDYQDAFLTHPVYDLVSLLTDARTDIDPAFRTRMIGLYADRSGDDPHKLEAAFAAFSAQRNLRILGIFVRAAKEFGKTGHLAKLPRVYGYFTEALRHPIFEDVAKETLAAIAPPEVVLAEVSR